MKTKYKLTVVSWENDGDNYHTHTMVVDSKEEAEKIKHICDNLFGSKNSTAGGIGNSIEGRDSEKVRTRIENYIENNPITLKGKKVNKGTIMDLNYDLLGSSEFYISRVCESCKIEININKGSEVHVVLSRDNGSYVFVTADPELAEKERKRQSDNEEMGGGRPSVYILTTQIK